MKQEKKVQKELNDYFDTPKKKSPERIQNKKNNKGVIGFEDKLWQSANKFRGNMDSAEYKHVVLGLIFLKYISDSFEEKRQRLIEEFKNEGYSETEISKELEIRDYYTAENIFWVPKEARWIKLQDSSKKPEIGKIVDEAMTLIEKENPPLKGVLPKIYARRELNKRVLGEVFDLIGDIGLGDKESKAKDLLGRIYEYFLGKFAQQEGKGGGQFFTPKCIVNLLIEMIQPFKGRVFDPCCGSGGMFVQSERFIEAHGGKLGDISIYGQESNPTTWKLAKMNLAIRGIEADLGGKFDDSFHNDLHLSLKANFILANPPFNDSDWGGDLLKDDVRWKKYNLLPPNNNANYAWILHFIHHLAPNGIAGFVLSNGSLSSQFNDEDKIRSAIIEDDLVDCIINLPTKLFLTTQVPACLWFLNRNKNDGNNRDRRGETLFIDARNFGHMINSKIKEFSENDILQISSIYHEWKSINSSYRDIKGLCKSVKIEKIKEQDFILTSYRYVGFDESNLDNPELTANLELLKTTIQQLLVESKELDEKILVSLDFIEEFNYIENK